MVSPLPPIETHPLEPFLPENGRILFLGSFPPPEARWSMRFFYPNFINDFWRIMGLLFFEDRHHFVIPGEKRFDHPAIEAFAREQGLAFYDTARSVRRLRGNASDAFLEIVEPTDIRALLAAMPHCHRIVTTGGKASEILMATLNIQRLPEIGTFTLCPSSTHSLGRDIEFWRMPSSSRAYPLALEKKAAFYQKLFEENVGTGVSNPLFAMAKTSATKSFVLRVDAETMNAIEAWAADEFRSTNGQLQWIIAEALRKSGRLRKRKTKPSTDDNENHIENPEV